MVEPPVQRSAFFRPVRWVARLIATALSFIWFGCGAAVLAFVVTVVDRGERDPLRRALLCQTRMRGFVALFHHAMRVMQLLEYDPRKVRIALPPGGCVIVANHPTLVDVTAVLSVVRGGCVVARTGLMRSFVLGDILRIGWHVDAGDGGAGTGERVIAGGAERLAAGLPVLVFPEGTRSPVRSIRRFKRGAFAMAMRADVPVVPLFITCDPPTLMKGVPWYALPKTLARMRVEQLPTVHPGEFRGDARALADHVAAMITERVRGWREAYGESRELPAEEAAPARDARTDGE